MQRLVEAVRDDVEALDGFALCQRAQLLLPRESRAEQAQAAAPRERCVVPRTLAVGGSMLQAGAVEGAATPVATRAAVT